LCEREQGLGTKQVLLQERIGFGTQPDKDYNEGRFVMQGANGIFHERVANLSSFLVSFLLLRATEEFESAAHLFFVRTSTLQIEDSNAEIFVFITIMPPAL
jgi:hypothetical protein